MRTLHVLSILLTSISLSAGIAHVLEMAPKMRLGAEQYVATQQLYRGWAFLGIAMFGALAVSIVLCIRERHRTTPFRLDLLGVVSIVLALVVFFVFTFPVNRVTSNWTTLPPNWEELRYRWEYSHAVGASLMFLALTALAAAATQAAATQATA